MLIYEHNGNILPLLRELVKSMFNGRVIRLLINNEEVFLRIRRVGYMLFTFVSEHIRSAIARYCCFADQRTPTPARRMPVTESCFLVSE